VGAPADVRLACQLRPSGDIEVVPLVGTERRWFSTATHASTTERDIVLLFLDLPGETATARAHLPQDTLYLLGRVADVFGGAVRASNGNIGRAASVEFMAVFGLGCDLAQASRQALRAAADIEAGMHKLDVQFAPEWGASVNYALVIDAGHAAVGEIGFQDTAALTAVGPAVDSANRLRALAAARGARFAISAAACKEAGLAPAPPLGPATGEAEGKSVEAFFSDAVPHSSEGA
jgi:adenylate cyclase